MPATAAVTEPLFTIFKSEPLAMLVMAREVVVAFVARREVAESDVDVAPVKRAEVAKSEVEVAFVRSAEVAPREVEVAFVKRPLVMMAVVAPRFVDVAPPKSAFVPLKLVEVEFTNVKLVPKRLPAVRAVVVTFWKMLVKAEPTFNGPLIVVEPLLEMLKMVEVAQSRVEEAMVKSVEPTGVVVGVARRETREVGAASPIPRRPVR